MFIEIRCELRISTPQGVERFVRILTNSFLNNLFEIIYKYMTPTESEQPPNSVSCTE